MYLCVSVNHGPISKLLWSQKSLWMCPLFFMVLTCNNRSFLVEQYQILIHISFRIRFLSICRSKSLTCSLPPLEELPNLLYSLQAINFLNFCLGKWLCLFHYWRTTSFDTEFYTGSGVFFFLFNILMIWLHSFLICLDSDEQLALILAIPL